MESPSGVTETRLVRTPTELVFYRFRVRVVDGPDREASVAAGDTELSIGTELANSLRLTDPTVSRHHCELRATELGLLIKDLGSTNGTAVDGVRIEAAYVKPGSRIDVGSTRLVLEVTDDEVKSPISADHRFDDLLGTSPVMRRIFDMIGRIAPSDATVLLEGETGTGKTLLAETLHRHSRRADGPFVVVDCGAIPPTLIESELFGHAKGAFTGAHAARQGAFAAANGGTLFLDEIGELSLEMQPKLLRALEQRQVKPVGADEDVSLDIRLIAATNLDLREAVNSGAFRSDLYYRLNTVRLRIPPLRERREDIPQLVSHFYRQFTGDDDAAPPSALVADLLRLPWKGNIRELRAAVERAVLLGDPALWRSLTEVGPEQTAVEAEHRTLDLGESFRAAKERAIAAFERWYVKELIETFGGNLSKAARAVHMDRNHLRDLCRKRGIDIPR